MTKKTPRLTEVFRRRLMREAKCPRCGTDGAYVGLNDVECTNPNCDKYKANTSGPTSGLKVFRGRDAAKVAPDLAKYIDSEYGDPLKNDAYVVQIKDGFVTLEDLPEPAGTRFIRRGSSYDYHMWDLNYIDQFSDAEKKQADEVVAAVRAAGGKINFKG